jgi:hypothetical protein
MKIRDNKSLKYSFIIAIIFLLITQIIVYFPLAEELPNILLIVILLVFILSALFFIINMMIFQYKIDNYFWYAMFIGIIAVIVYIYQYIRNKQYITRKEIEEGYQYVCEDCGVMFKGLQESKKHKCKD